MWIVGSRWPPGVPARFCGPSTLLRHRVGEDRMPQKDLAAPPAFVMSCSRISSSSRHVLAAETARPDATSLPDYQIPLEMCRISGHACVYRFTCINTCKLKALQMWPPGRFSTLNGCIKTVAWSTSAFICRICRLGKHKLVFAEDVSEGMQPTGMTCLTFLLSAAVMLSS